jgi:hypothetical protein
MDKNGRQPAPTSKPKRKGRELVFLTQLRGEESDAELERLAEAMAAAFDEALGPNEPPPFPTIPPAK